MTCDSRTRLSALRSEPKATNAYSLLSCLRGRWHYRLLQRDAGLGEGHLVFRVLPVARRVDNGRGDKNHQVFLLGLAGFAAEETPHNREVTQQRDLIREL